MSKIGVLGGTFNPIHIGHIKLANYCKSSLNLDKIILIPTFIPPHKNSKGLVSEQHRLNMCKIATKNIQNFTVSNIEILRKGKSYTFETLNYLKQQLPCDELFLIVGADMFLTLAEWKNPSQIFNLASIISIPRDESNYSQLVDYNENVLKPMGAKCFLLKNKVENISSTFVRENIKDNNKISKFIDKDVYEYIVKNKIYGV